METVQYLVGRLGEYEVPTLINELFPSMSLWKTFFLNDRYSSDVGGNADWRVV